MIKLILLFVVFLVVLMIVYKMYSAYKGNVIKEVDVADKQVNSMYRNSDFDTAVTFQNLDL